MAEDTVITYLLEQTPWVAAALALYWYGRKDLAASNERYDNLNAKLLEVIKEQNDFLRTLSQNGKSD